MAVRIRDIQRSDASGTGLVGRETKGLSASVVSRLKRQWQSEYDDRRKRDLGEKHFLAIEDGVKKSTRSWRELLLET